LGGEVSQTFDSGKTVKVTFPAQAITGTVVITIEAQDKTAIVETNPLPENTQIVGDLVADFKAISGSEELKTFEKDVTLIFTYTDEQISGLNEQTLKIYYWDGTQWVALTSVVNTTANTVTATTGHFTYFAVLGQPVEAVQLTTIEELQNRIDELLKQIAAIKLQIQQIKLVEAIPADFRFTGAGLLKKGLRSDEVKYLQIILRSEVGADVVGAADGIFGSKTDAAVKQFQTVQGLTSDGLIGKNTKSKLNEILGQ
jgi:murein L,D-transpeptidase YcbB/YkuD